MKNRIISIVLQIEDEAEAKKVWDHHMNGTCLCGSKVMGIAEGNLIEKIDRIYEEIREDDLMDD